MRLAIGAPGENVAAPIQDGRVRFFDWDGSTWIQSGEIVSETLNEVLGDTLVLSGDGNRVAVRSAVEVNVYPRGIVRVFGWDGSPWNPAGANIEGETGSGFGASLALSVDGSRLAIGVPYEGGPNDDAGAVRVFDWVDAAWAQAGAGHRRRGPRTAGPGRPWRSPAMGIGSRSANQRRGPGVWECSTGTARRGSRRSRSGSARRRRSRGPRRRGARIGLLRSPARAGAAWRIRPRSTPHARRSRPTGRAATTSRPPAPWRSAPDRSRSASGAPDRARRRRPRSRRPGSCRTPPLASARRAPNRNVVDSSDGSCSIGTRIASPSDRTSIGGGGIRGANRSEPTDVTIRLIDTTPITAFTTSSGRLQADSRTVVLRAVSRVEKRVECYTDVRSKKVAQLIRQPAAIATWHFYDPSAKVQLRLRGHTDVIGGPAAERTWPSVPLPSRGAYLSIETPGTRAEGKRPPRTDDRNASHAESERGLANFRIVRTVVETADWLYLRPTGHVRAQVDYQNDPSAGWNWVVP